MALHSCDPCNAIDRERGPTAALPHLPRLGRLASIARGACLIGLPVVLTSSLMLRPITATAQVEVEQTTAQEKASGAETTLSSSVKRERADRSAQQAVELYQGGQLKEAEPKFAEALRLYREILGEEHPDTLSSLNNYAFVLDALGRAAEAEPLYAEALMRKRKVLGGTHPDTLSGMNNYAAVLVALGRTTDAEPLYAEALRMRREVLGDKHPDTLTSINNYAFVLDALGRADAAAPLFAEALGSRRTVLGERHPDTLTSINNYGGLLQTLGRSAEAEPLYAEALRLRREELGDRHPDTLNSINNYAFVLEALGRPEEAEPYYAEALRSRREVLGMEHPDTLSSLGNYASVLDSLGRPAEAAPIYAEAMVRTVEVLGTKHPDTLTSFNNYAHVLEQLGRADDAETLLAAALKTRREVLGDTHPDTLASLNNYASILQTLGKPAEAEPLYAEALRLRRAQLGPNHPETLNSMSNHAFALRALERIAEAETLNAQVLDLRRTVLGDHHPDTLTSMNNLTFTRIGLPAASHLAIDPARSLISGIRAMRLKAGYSPAEEAQQGRRDASQSDDFRLFVIAAWLRGPGLSPEARTAGAKPLGTRQQAALREEVFTALQDVLAGAAGKAIAASIARKAAGPLEPLAIEREVLSEQWIGTERALVAALGGNDAASDSHRDALRTQLSALDARMKTIDARLRNEAPDYFALTRPDALRLGEAQALLAPDEAALMVVPTEYGTHVMLVSDEGLRWMRSDWATDRIDAAVKRLLWDVGGNVDVDSVEAATWENEGAGAYPFAFDTAHSLYRELIAPVADGLKGKRHLFISASGSLSSLPFGLLVSEVPAGASGDPVVLRSAKWFADAHVLVQIPSLQSLEFLRKYRTQRSDAAALPFLGVGDPVLDGKAEQRGGRGARVARTSGNGAFKRVFAGSQTRSGGGIANISGLKTMARLPGTATELTAMWEQFGKPGNALHLAERATEGFVRAPGNLNASIIAFATHGLLAGEIGGTAEPGLVLTPPSEGSEANDGYLSTSEIAALKLNADWVILSACNTAAGDGSEGAPGLSGLARSFFYAGARNLLASHWPVRDDVAAKLTVRTIAIARENPGLSRAEAFQQAMREIREDTSVDSQTDTWAHPSAWAPFSLIGDGAN